ncbi:helix-turn-helix transcriptional regulator [Microbacterium sp. zg.Y625]|uniref:helix-turn-helix domain-containing protein n=1 Tax=Microbacterium jiangjiandongii TaxID=3049071 RepID=UPI00214CA1E5|nr:MULTISPECIES: helix-turn-helix transcriptional regulator [unclassified Microbacterium]MCR2793845.1 helix-turn-helix transcriptional regulator [Microbacterium sp. zg.Y625]MCR2816075.1 helix-turn-helix transcriptional regulator [Microbacterium sp. zg.Y843]WIM26184.1 helix-turn-helix transcriptional regulator [Microbacterium sp. zg-Y625]
MQGARTRAIGTAERSGVLQPQNLERFRAQWIPPAEDVRDVVDTYWAVTWRLEPGESIDQRIIDHPSITLSIERGDVFAPLVVTSARSTAWTRTISGVGGVFAIRLRPAGLAVVSDLAAWSLPHEREVTADLDGRCHRLLEQIAATPGPTARAEAADALVRELRAERPLAPSQRLANAGLDAIAARPHVRRTSDVADALGVGVRTLQRALHAHVGRGPSEIARRVRLQEVVRRLSTEHGSLADIAVELGYVDQAHLTNDFRAVAGVTPGAYLRTQAQAQAALAVGSGGDAHAARTEGMPHA